MISRSDLIEFIKAAAAVIAAVIGLYGYTGWATEHSRVPDEIELIEPVIIECTTDADCIAKNPHIIEDPDCEWVGDECLTLQQRVDRQAQPDWSSGGESVCVLDPLACEQGLGE